MEKKLRRIYKKLIGLGALCVGLLAGTVTASGAMVGFVASLNETKDCVAYVYAPPKAGSQIVQLTGYEYNKASNKYIHVSPYKAGSGSDDLGGVFATDAGYIFLPEYMNEKLMIIANTNGVTYGTIYLE